MALGKRVRLEMIESALDHRRAEFHGSLLLLLLPLRLLLFRKLVLNFGSGHSHLDAVGFLNEQSCRYDYRNRLDTQEVAEFGTDYRLVTRQARMCDLTQSLSVGAVNCQSNKRSLHCLRRWRCWLSHDWRGRRKRHGDNARGK